MLWWSPRDPCIMSGIMLGVISYLLWVRVGLGHYAYLLIQYLGANLICPVIFPYFDSTSIVI